MTLPTTNLWLPLIVSLASGVCLTPVSMRLARRLGFVTRAEQDEWNQRSTPLMGGVAIFVAVSLGWVALEPGFPVAVWIGATLMFATGLVDDVRALTPSVKLLAQTAAASVLLVSGYEFASALPGWASVALTFAWVIGITNAVNLLDNMDGLAAGIVAIAAAAMAFLGLVSAAGDAEAGMALAVLGGSLGFLVFNFPTAKVFMGDSGSLVLGYVIAALAITSTGGQPSDSALAAAVIVPPALLAVPIFDTTLVTLNRLSAGRSVTEGGADHTSHRLVVLGLDDARAVVMLYGVAALFSVIALSFTVLDVLAALSLTGMALVGLTAFGAFLSRSFRADSGASASGTDSVSRFETVRALVRLSGLDRRAALLVGDLLLVVASLVLAHFLRYEDGLGDEHLARLGTALPLVATVKLAAFYLAGVYRTLPRYTGALGLLKILRGSVAGSVLTGLILAFWFALENVSMSVLVIDFLLCTMAMIGTRGLYRMLRSYFGAHRMAMGGRRALLYGAGDAGSLALREIRQNPEIDVTPLGFVDDADDKQGALVHGVPVVGQGCDLETLLKHHEVDDVIITISECSDLLRREVKTICRRSGVGCREMRLNFDDVAIAATDEETGEFAGTESTKRERGLRRGGQAPQPEPATQTRRKAQ